MAILSIRFLLFVTCLLFIYYVIPKKVRWVVLLIGSIGYYYLSSEKLIFFLVLSILSIYLVGLILSSLNNKIGNFSNKQNDKKIKLLKKKKMALFLGIIINILFIIMTKYFNFTIGNINSVLKIFNITGIRTSFKILIPLGISYYTLEAISYMVDVYRGKYPATKNIFKVALFLLYFPKIIEGPISRFNELSKEFYENNSLDFKKITIGCDLIIWGLFKKMVVADRAGIFVNNAFGVTGGITAFMAMVLYTLQLYAEFSGCIDIIRGVSLLFGIRLPLNFKNPFFSKNIQEFWRRWHISLGAWIKEYVFYPISFSKINMKVTMFAKKHLNNYFYKFISAAFPLLFVWIINGIWHGASYKYIAYGMYYYILMMIGLLLAPVSAVIIKKLKIRKFIVDFTSIIRTIIIVIIGMTLFRATSVSEFISVIASLFKSGNGLIEYGLTMIDFYILIVSVIIMLIVALLNEFKKVDIEKGLTNSIIIRSVIYSLLLCAIVIFGIYGEGYDVANFIYGAF